MRRMILGIAVITALTPAAIAPVSGSAGALAKRGCGSIDLGGPKVFAKHNMRCSQAKSYAKDVYASRGEDEPRRFNCSSGSGFEEGGFCEHVSKEKYFSWHPGD